MPPADKRGSERTPVGLLVRLSYGSVDEFTERFAVNISRGGIFIRTREPRPVGTLLAFDLRLQGGETVIRGRGVVRWIREERPDAHPPTAPGMGVQFTWLDERSQALVERMAARKELRGAAPGVGAPAPIAPRPDRTPAPTRAPLPASPTVAPSPAPTPPPAATPPALPRAGATATPAPPPRADPAPALADLSRPHRVEQLEAGLARVATGLPDEPVPITRPSRHVIGIDLGTSNSCAAVVRDGRPYVIPSREGYNTVPSIVALNARNRIVVGHLARAQLLTNPRATVWGAKRLVGRAFDSPVVQEIKGKFAYEIVAGPDGLAAVRLGPETLTLEQVSALVLAEVKEVAQNHLGEEVNRAVITVPAYYNERQRAAVRHAGALAGLKVERILNEPTAAALAYAFGRHLDQRVLVYDLGGGTFDASVLELNDNVYEVVSTGGDTFLGGVDFDNRIVERMLAAWQRVHGAPFSGDRVALSRMVDAAERAKCALSERTEHRVDLPFLSMADGQPLSLEVAISRDEVVELVAPLVDRTLEVCREVLAARSLSATDIDEVILVGGQSRMPLVHQKVGEFFGRAPSRAVHPDEAVAVGAALLAHSLQGAEGVVLIDVLPMSIGIGLPGGRVKTIMERNTPLPARKQYGLTTSHDGQTEFELVVLQGEGANADDCEYLGTLRLEGLPPGPRGMVKIAVTFELGAECLLTVTARELNTGRKVQAVMSAREGAASARRRLEREGAPAVSTGSFPVPSPGAAGPSGDPTATGAARGLGGLLRRLLGRSEAR
ncbi:2-alkenal reductase [Anaeromyxobacter dehalogenans 2CP-1]|uniref:2-alkenal reductase n=1 Tax=Anaeromyxobacter dehalogenans (strain ATCC BAA-258 / DSM 21875 / 2CP-1) TaxID=455488 RepID=B8J5L1_ANAD2|nr:TIGR02266 family protein [Anaeromyxobacter dehalogenans]ACL64958.1 2-alkenal reductase [Anaeromyxobacter dehalogenans 2CP-1]